jgi:purine-binding chemotaxis protein CheW
VPLDSTARCAGDAAKASQQAAGSSTETWVLFLVDDQRYGLPLWEVERIVRAVEVKPLPEAPAHIRGIINVQGRVLPVVDLRVRFGQPTRDIQPEDHFIIANAPTTAVVLPVDVVLGTIEATRTADADDPTQTPCMRKVMALDLGVVYAPEPERVLFADLSPTDSDFAALLAELQLG